MPARVSLEIGTTISLRFKGYLFDFKTQTQAIAAMRDVLFGYKCILSEAGIVPGAITPSSILLEMQDAAAERPRGVLIDFDISTSTKHADRQSTQGPLKMYMSAADLESCRPHNYPSPPHDEMDDLESAHYVLSELMFGFKGPKRQLVAKRRPEMLVKWERETYSNAYASKLAYFSDEDLDTEDVLAYWLPACKTLLCALHRLLTPVVRKKRRLAKRYCEEKRKALECLLEGSGALYQSALGLFDKALDELRDVEVA
ncbi:hypothetical protein DFP72DRAFT_881349 [Ephemerocybe angulata]|uniref:Fungal-type protein kinase domain-containing protein n=1 Tax=Ephemerocybe angulata TaxID=980116 RepID=A0A8H6MCE3_9AGAR|nr:hypothetical protein DFP72DRAFT_881349 [Tulosesus angulatus]